MELEYIPSFQGVTQVEVIGYTGENYFRKNLKNIKNKWFISLLDFSEKIRYKFVVNQAIRLNDSHSEWYEVDNQGEVWSVYDGKDKEKIIPSIELTEYKISDRVRSRLDLVEMKKVINMVDNIKLSVGVHIKNITGTHSITIMWFQPDGRIFSIEERALVVPREHGMCEAETWFWLDVSQITGQYAEGIWGVQVYLDGMLSVNDNFALGRRIYSQHIAFDYKI